MAAATATRLATVIGTGAGGAVANAPYDPIAAIIGGPPRTARAVEMQRLASAGPAVTRAPSGFLYDTRFLAALFAVGLVIVAIGAWLLITQATSPAGEAVLPGNGITLPGGISLPLAVAVLLLVSLGGTVAARRGLPRKAPQPAVAKPPGKGWRWLYDIRVLATVVALALAGYGFSLIAPPGSTPDLREIPGEVNNALQGAVAQPESGYPRIKLLRVAIDLLMVKGDGKTPPVKYEAFTYPGADHLLTGSQSGGSNTYVYAHARTGMFWRLHDLHIGDVVDIDYGAGKMLHYRVSEIHPTVNWKDFSWLQPTGDDRLTLQTCNGWRDDDPRFIVVARRIPDATALTP